MSDLNIPAEAVEAAAEAMEDAALSLIGSDLGTTYRNDIARLALEAAAPYMMAEAWDEGCVEGQARGEDLYRLEGDQPNPYRK